MKKLRRIVFCVCALVLVAGCAAAVAAQGASAHWSTQPGVCVQTRFHRAALQTGPAALGSRLRGFAP